MTAVPGNRLRFVAGVNGGGGFSAWITGDGGQTFKRAIMPAALDAPGEAGLEASKNCCDPMSAADSAGNIWYGGLSQANGAGNPSRIIVGRIAAGSDQFQPTIVGLQARTTGTQDKPLMTLDNSPSSPRYGTLYVVWNEPGATGGINVVISQCDTRPVGTTLNAAHCDDADNWTAPVSVSPATGSYIYADVAAGPDGKVYVTWWDYSAANAIVGDVCDPSAQDCASAAGWGTPETIATLDATGGTPIPFACPIVAQPGGRASTAPNVEVDHSSGPNRGRVYVTWGDLRTGSGSTRCSGNVAPSTTHLSWDSFVASAPGALPGSAQPSPAVATRLLTDGEGGGDASSDDWFPWLAVDQTTGRAWADFYSTRHDATRKTTHFYVREVTPAGSGHTLGTLTQVSTEASDYSTSPCCGFGNDYGDYTGIDATSGVAIPIWSDKRPSGSDGEAFTYIGQNPSLRAAAPAIDDAAGGDGDGYPEPGESFQLTQPLTNAGTAAATKVSGKLSESAPTLSLQRAASAYPDAATGATVANGTSYVATIADGAVCGAPAVMSLDLQTDQGRVTIPVRLPTGKAGTPVSTTSTTPAPIPDANPDGATSTIELSGAGAVADMNVKVNITHSWMSDLTVSLIAPDGTSVILASRLGASADGYIDTVFDDEATAPIGAGSYPYTASYRPAQPLDAMDGKPIAGTWKLKVVDEYASDSGTVNSWGTEATGVSCSRPLPRRRADFNGDGYSDVAAGAPGEDNGALADVGSVNVGYGSGAGMRSTGSAAFTADSPGVPGRADAGDRFGAAVTAGYYNEDRYADLAIGAPGDDVGTVADAGSVTVLYGSPSGLTGTGSELFAQPVASGTPADANAEPGDAFGSALATGNLGRSTTSFDDLAVGIPREDAGGLEDAGAVEVLYSGSTGGINPSGRQFLTQSALGADPSEAGDRFGTALASANFNSTSAFDDLAIGVPLQDAGGFADAGAVHVANGGTAGLSSANDAVFSQSSPAAVPGDDEANDQFGAALAAGNFSGGPSAEVAVGVPGQAVGGRAGAGQVTVLPGSLASTTASGSFALDQDTTDVLDAAEAGDRFGAALAIGDFGGSSQGDLAVGTPNESVGTAGQAGQVSVFPGSTAAVPPVTGNQVFNQNTADVADVAEASDHFGAALAAGQFGGDPKADLVIGIPDENVGTSADAGAVQLLLGGASAGLSADGNQFRRQGVAPQLGGSLETGDLLGTALG